MSAKKRIRRLEKTVLQLAQALLLHTRTDVAPDAALPGMRKLVRRLQERAR